MEKIRLLPSQRQMDMCLYVTLKLVIPIPVPRKGFTNEQGGELKSTKNSGPGKLREVQEAGEAGRPGGPASQPVKPHIQRHPAPSTAGHKTAATSRK